MKPRIVWLLFGLNRNPFQTFKIFFESCRNQGVSVRRNSKWERTFFEALIDLERANNLHVEIYECVHLDKNNNHIFVLKSESATCFADFFVDVNE